MGKKTIYLVLILLVALLLVYLYRYKTSPCMCSVIPKDSDAVVHVNVRMLEKYLLHDKLSHPSSIFNSRSDKTKEKIDKEPKKNSEPKSDSKSETRVKLLECISIPKSLVFYRLKRKNKLWISSELDIKDATKLTLFLSQIGFDPNANIKNIYNKEQFNVVINKDKLRVVYSDKASAVTSMPRTEDLVFQTKGDLLFDAVLQSKSDITYVDAEGQYLHLNSGLGTINIDGQYKFETLLVTNNETKSKGIAKLTARFDIEKSIGLLSQNQKDKFINFTKLNIDSLRQYMNGDITAVLKGFHTISDTITTYDYDDDFNKIEVKQVKSSVTPSYNVALGMTDEGVAYMRRQNAIVEYLEKDVLAIMPLVPTYCKTELGTLHLFTNDIVLPHVAESETKMNLSLDIKKCLGVSEFVVPDWSKYLKDVDKLNISINGEDRVKGEILFEEQRNAIVTILD